MTTLQQQLQALFPGEDITATLNDEALILSGASRAQPSCSRAGEIAQASASKAQGHQHAAAAGRAGQPAGDAAGAVRRGEPAGCPGARRQSLHGPERRKRLRRADDDTAVHTHRASTGTVTTFSDFLNLFVINTKYNVGAVIRALQDKGYFQSLAEPNLIAYNGQEASFLAGGEFPVPVVQGLTNAVTIQWKEFGVRLKFTPTIAGDVIRLKVEPEVSSLDFNNGITLQGFRIPALITRYAQTDVELRDGQSFAIAGLLHNMAQEDGSTVPILSSIPIIGNLFKSKADRKEQTELMVLITPQLVRPLDPDEVPALPTSPEAVPPGSWRRSRRRRTAGLVDAPPVAPKPVPPVVKKNP